MWPFLESPIESHIWQSRLYISCFRDIAISTNSVKNLRSLSYWSIKVCLSRKYITEKLTYWSIKVHSVRHHVLWHDSNNVGTLPSLFGSCQHLVQDDPWVALFDVELLDGVSDDLRDSRVNAISYNPHVGGVGCLSNKTHYLEWCYIIM